MAKKKKMKTRLNQSKTAQVTAWLFERKERIIREKPQLKTLKMELESETNIPIHSGALRNIANSIGIKHYKMGTSVLKPEERSRVEMIEKSICELYRVFKNLRDRHFELEVEAGQSVMNEMHYKAQFTSVILDRVETQFVVDDAVRRLAADRKKSMSYMATGCDAKVAAEPPKQKGGE